MSVPPPSDPSTAAGYIGGALNQSGHGLGTSGVFVRSSDGDVLIREGEPQDALYFVLTGTLEVSTSKGDKSVMLATLGEGDSLGEVNLFDPGTASATVTSKGDSIVWRIRRAELDGLIHDEPASGIALLKGLITQLSARLRLMNEKLLDAQGWDSTTS